MPRRSQSFYGKPSFTLDPETEHLRSLLHRNLDRLVVADDGVQWQATIKQMKDLADKHSGFYGDIRMCFKSCYVVRLLRCAVLEILMYVQYTPVSALRAPCTRTAHDTFKIRFKIRVVSF